MALSLSAAAASASTSILKRGGYLLRFHSNKASPCLGFVVSSSRPHFLCSEAFVVGGRSRRIVSSTPSSYFSSPSRSNCHNQNTGNGRGSNNTMAKNNGALTEDVLAELRRGFYSDPKNRLAQNMVCKSDPLEATISRAAIESSSAHVFSHKVDEAKPMTNQKSSGRCWLFACLNAMRVPFAKAKQLDEFEFSQAHLFFWDKIERCNYFLHAVIEAGRRQPKETPDGRLFSFLLSNPTCDGGQWDMVANLINKHGVMPKKCFPESYSCESSRRLNQLLKTKLREFCFELLTMLDSGASDEELRGKISSQMEVVYRVVGICLGVPPATFEWEYYDKNKKVQRVGPIQPRQFYVDHVKPLFDVDSKVCLVSDPRPENPTGKLYTVDFLGNVVGGRRTIYNNQPIDVLMEATEKSVRSGDPVWFGCDVSKHMASAQGLLDPGVHDHELVFGTAVNRRLDKAQRMVYGDSEMNHAMLITGVHIPQEEGAEDAKEGATTNGAANGEGGERNDEKIGRATRFRVENSWGENRNEKGYLRMTADWFREFVFEVVVDKKFVPEEVTKESEEEPKLLPAWDPMGALAREG